MSFNPKKLEVGKVVHVADANRGVLLARKGANGAVTFYWRWRYQGKEGRIAIGIYDSKIPPLKADTTLGRYNVLSATIAANMLADEHIQSIRSGNDGIATLLEERKKQKEAESDRKKRESAEREHALALRNEWTLGKLLDMYCDHLKSKGKDSYKEAHNIFSNHVRTPYKRLCASPANELTADNVVDMMRRLNEQGKERTANKLRTYLRSAYTVARSSKTNASINHLFTRFCIVHNPVSETEPNTAANRTDKNPLSTDEMRIYWRIIQSLEGARGAFLRLHLLTGAQRPAQLVRLNIQDTKADCIILWDKKGKRTEPRKHEVPLIKEARIALKFFGDNKTNVISTDGGITHLSSSTATNWASEVVGAAIPQFKLKRVRSGVETILSKHGLSLEVRGELQSHGLGGVQKRSYDGNDFLTEKQKALETLINVLNDTSGKVIAIKRKRA